jgi:hypothetical protein
MPELKLCFEIRTFKQIGDFSFFEVEKKVHVAFAVVSDEHISGFLLVAIATASFDCVEKGVAMRLKIFHQALEFQNEFIAVKILIGDFVVEQGIEHVGVHALNEIPHGIREAA